MRRADLNSATPSTREAGPRGQLDGGEAEPLPNMPPLQTIVGLRWHDHSTSRWYIEFSTRIVDNQDRVATSLLESSTPGFTVFDLKAHRKLGKSLALNAGVENLTDKHYREYLDFRAENGISMFRPGLNCYLTAEWTF